MYYLVSYVHQQQKRRSHTFTPNGPKRLFAELVESLNKGAGITLESSEGNLAGRMQANEPPCLVAVLSWRQTGDCYLNAD